MSIVQVLKDCGPLILLLETSSCSLPRQHLKSMSPSSLSVQLSLVRKVKVILGLRKLLDIKKKNGRSYNILFIQYVTILDSEYMYPNSNTGTLVNDFPLKNIWDFPGGEVIRTSWFHCRGHEFDPWSGESQGRGSLVGCRLWGRTESDTTEAT